MVSAKRDRFSSLVSLIPYSACLFALAGLALLPGAPTRAQEREGRFIGPGVRLLQWTSPAGPHALHAVEVDTAQPYVRLGVSAGKASGLGLDLLSRQAERLTQPDRYPIAGVNGDYFFYPSTTQPGIPTNALVLGGELVRTPMNRSCLVLDPNGVPSIRILRARSGVTFPSGVQRTLEGVNQPRGANQLVLYTPWYGPTTRTSKDGTEVYLVPEEGQFPLRPGLPLRARVDALQRGQGDAPIAAGRWVLSGSGAAGALLQGLTPGDSLELRVDLDPAIGPQDHVMGGGPRIVRDGKVSVEDEGGTLGESFARARHPRTAIGFKGRKLYLLVVDGRQPGYSAGMSLPELAQAMVDLGCTEALNMDGGGSSVLWVRGSVLNRPSDGRERSVANGLLVFSTAPKGEAVRLLPNRTEVAALAGAPVPVTFTGEDQYYNPTLVPTGQIRWTVDPRLGTVSAGKFVAAADVQADPGRDYAAGELVAEVGAIRGTLPLRIYPRPERLEVLPGITRLGPQIRRSFEVRAFDKEGRRLILPEQIRWQASPEVGEVDTTGTLLTGTAGGRGTVAAVVNGVTAQAQVEVSLDAARALDDFETAEDWKLRRVPETIAGSVSIAAGKARSGKKALRLEYDFAGGMGTRAVYAQANRHLGNAVAMKLWVHGDGQGVWLRARVRDGKQTLHTLDLIRKVDWKDTWREVRLAFSDDLPTPLTLESIYVVETDTNLKPKGALLVDDLSVDQ